MEIGLFDTTTLIRNPSVPLGCVWRERRLDGGAKDGAICPALDRSGHCGTSIPWDAKFMKLAAPSISGYVSGNREIATLARSKKVTLAAHRRRRRRQGVVRLEVQVRQADVPLVRRVVAALADDQREAEARAVLREHFNPLPTTSLKALLAAAPLEDIDLDRDRDVGRDVEI